MNDSVHYLLVMKGFESVNSAISESSLLFYYKTLSYS